MNQSELAKKLGISQSYLSKGLKWANRNKNRNIHENNESHQYITDKRIRLHALAVKFNFTNSLNLELLPAISSIGIRDAGELRGHTDKLFQIDGIKGRLSSKSLSLWAKESIKPFKSSIIELEIEVLGELYAKAEYLATRLNLSLESNPEGELVGELRQEHIALMNNEIAESVKEHNAKLETKDPIDGKIRVITDYSKGYPEYEAVHRKHAVFDAGELKEFSEFVYTKGFKEWKVAVDSNLLKTTEIITEQNKFFVKHNDLIDTINNKIKLLEPKEDNRVGVLRRVWRWIW